ncbi:hypothetical protein CANARDRAFT_27229 [[Candida] arabinofermentans NRRL YB-2248]|uniref:Cell wall mannoprotein PIR1-like C-terminal domain-containing protein n=1 Tax=[Candida] arabinofermentans NRRL YB-2248 TaxID=983967 RepID=A0A1E4T522_9ASCO|nr:hypothetical protein CANARDRAFT_27229 [[Candida] arabinofermentans NRRL YB-2248]
MRTSILLPTVLALASNALASYDPNATGADYSTLTPDSSPIGDINPTGTYGIHVETFAADSKLLKRGYASLPHKKAHAKVKSKAKAKAKAKPKAKSKSSSKKSHKKNKKGSKKDAVVTQIGDGQIQVGTATTTNAIPAQTVVYNTEQVVTQIGDGQLQFPASQVQVITTPTPTVVIQTTTAVAATEYTDGQVEVLAEEESSVDDDDGTGVYVGCYEDDTLAITFSDGIMYDASGRVGAIVSNHQLQFDGPPPQSGSLYAAGWNIDDEGYLNLGDQDVFWQCAQDDYFKLYDDQLYDTCSQVMIKMVDLISC